MAEFEKRLACVINADGTIARGYMIERCELQGENRYVITWKVPLQNEAKTNFSCVIGSTDQEARLAHAIVTPAAKLFGDFHRGQLLAEFGEHHRAAARRPRAL